MITIIPVNPERVKCGTVSVNGIKLDVRPDKPLVSILVQNAKSGAFGAILQDLSPVELKELLARAVSIVEMTQGEEL